MFICTGWITVPSPISVRSAQIQTYPRTRRALLHLLRLQYRSHGHPQRSSSSTCLVPFSPAILRFIILHLRNLSMCNHAGLSGESSAPGPFSVPISETSHGCVPLCLDFPGSVMTSGMVNICCSSLSQGPSAADTASQRSSRLHGNQNVYSPTCQIESSETIMWLTVRLLTLSGILNSSGYQTSIPFGLTPGRNPPQNRPTE